MKSDEEDARECLTALATAVVTWSSEWMDLPFPEAVKYVEGVIGRESVRLVQKRRADQAGATSPHNIPGLQTR